MSKRVGTMEHWDRSQKINVSSARILQQNVSAATATCDAASAAAHRRCMADKSSIPGAAACRAAH